MKISLSLTAKSPYHSAPVSGGAFIVTDEGRIVKKSAGGSGSPLTRTYSEPHYLASLGQSVYYPVIRSMQIVKQLREITTSEIYNSLKSRELRIDKISTFSGMEVGAASGKPAQMTPTLDQLTQSLETPIALFGGGSFSLKSLLSVGDGTILHEQLLEDGLVEKPSHIDSTKVASGESYTLTYPVPITRNDPINSPTFSILDNFNVVDEYQSQVKEWQGGVADARNSRKADSSVKKTDLNNLVAAEVVVRGVVFVSELSIPENAGGAVKGAVITALLQAIEKGMVIGGRVSRGMGKFEVGVSIDGEKLDAQTGVARFEDELEQYSHWLDDVTPDDLALFFEA